MKITTAYCAIALLILLVMQSAPTRADTSTCPGTGITVIADDSLDIDEVCLGATEAIAFLNANDLDTDISLQIHLVPHIPECRTKNAFGCYNKKSRRAYVLPLWACCSETGDVEVFGLPMDRELYQSLVAHEVAHAIVNDSFKFADPSWIAHEYIAHVTQIATLPQEHRDRIMALYPNVGFERLTQINPMILLMEPGIFSVQSYGHYQKPENGKAFVQQLLSGQVKLKHGLMNP